MFTTRIVHPTYQQVKNVEISAIRDEKHLQTNYTASSIISNQHKQ